MRGNDSASVAIDLISSSDSSGLIMNSVSSSTSDLTSTDNDSVLICDCKQDSALTRETNAEAREERSSTLAICFYTTFLPARRESFSPRTLFTNICTFAINVVDFNGNLEV